MKWGFNMHFSVTKQDLLNKNEIERLNIEWCLDVPVDNWFNISVTNGKFSIELMGWVFTNTPNQLILRNLDGIA